MTNSDDGLANSGLVGGHLESVVKAITAKRAHEEENLGDKVEKQTLSWSETAKAAGVVTMITAATEEQPSFKISEAKKKLKKKTPKEYRLEAPKKKTESSITLSDKKQFKEGFITDKARFLKRQLKYNRSQNFLILVEDNIHSVGSGSETAGMIMAFGAGNLKERFLTEGIKFRASDYYLHANATDFKREHVKEIPATEKEAETTGKVAERTEEKKQAGRTEDQDAYQEKRKGQKNLKKKKLSLKKTKYDLYLEASAKENNRTSVYASDSSSSSN